MKFRALTLSLTACFLGVAPACAQHDHAASKAGGGPPLFEGLGRVRHKITTKSPLAQRYFDQGLRLAYGFNHDEAGRAFAEAARLDPDCAMARWGEALVLGPNINLPMSAEAEKRAYESAQRALNLAPNAGEAERAYIEALAKRYDAVPGANRAAHDSAYADAMRDLVKRYSEDVDAAVLCAEALMDLRPWDLWTLDGKAQPGTPEILSILERAIRMNSDHIGALHLYIHAVEASPEPARAEPHADRLAKLAPNAGHLVHMPTHVYMRVGRYNDAEALNARAIQTDRDYITKHGVKGVYTLMYYPHNIHMRWSALCSEGRRAEAIAAARELGEVVPEAVVREMLMVEFFRPPYYLTMTRFGMWEEILKSPAPSPDLRLTRAAWHYARGFALAATGKSGEARAERDSINAIGASLPADAYWGLNPAAPVVRFMSTHLGGEIAARAGNAEEAIRSLRAATAAQDSLRYDEPPAWNASARQSLGAVLLVAGRAAEAETVYREDLARLPENGWSLYGLTQALRAQKKEKEAAAAEGRFRRSWKQSDVTLQASRY